MKINDLEDVLLEGDFNQFLLFFKEDEVNEIKNSSMLNSLQLVLIKKGNYEDRLKIVKYLIKSGIDVNYIDNKEKKNALHYLFSNNTQATIPFYLEVVKELTNSNININQKDKYGAIPLTYAIANVKLSSIEMKPIYMLLMKKGSNYRTKDKYENSCLDYALRFSWRTEFLEFVEEYENGK